MNAGDILYSNVDTRPLCVMVRRGDGQWWDFEAGTFAVEPQRWWLPLTPDAKYPQVQSCVVPAAAVEDWAAMLVEAVLGKTPLPTQCYWAGLVPVPKAVTLASARGAVVRFTP